MRRLSLTRAVIGALVVGSALTALLYILGTRYLIASRWPWDLEPQADDVQFDMLRLVLAFVAGVGAVVALVISYRKQAEAESRRFTEEFTNAAQLMASTEIAESVAGAHAMAAAIDGTRDHYRRKQGVDQLCGYLRLSTDRARDPYLSEMSTTRESEPDVHRTEHYKFKTRENEMRRAVVAVLADHRPVITGHPGLRRRRLKSRAIFAAIRQVNTEYPGLRPRSQWLKFVGSASRDLRNATSPDPRLRLRYRDHWLDQRLNLAQADLQETDLSFTFLAGANLRGANLIGVKLVGADLTGTKLIGAQLVRANLSYANLARANLTRVDLRDADLSQAKLFQVDLSSALLDGANLDEAKSSESTKRPGDHGYVKVRVWGYPGE